MARINDVMEQDNMYSVLFLKKHNNGSYYWPDKEYICDVNDTDVFKMNILPKIYFQAKLQYCESSYSSTQAR